MCRNKHSSDTECDAWAENDHCDINPGWMKRFCAKACGACGNAHSDKRVTRKLVINTGM